MVQSSETGCFIIRMAAHNIYSMFPVDAVFGIVTYNLHGLNNGRSLLVDLCNDPAINIIAVQEHWLTPNNLHLLNNVHPDFMGFGISAMSNRLEAEIYRGRPYGGVGFIWRRCISKRFRISRNDTACRCLAASFEINCGEVLNLVNVYFPCHDASAQYSIDLGYCLGFIEDVLVENKNNDTIILGDFNFGCDSSNVGYKQCMYIFDSYAISMCDDLCTTHDRATYYNHSLGQSSCIDHCCVSSNLRKLISNLTITDTGSNLSDHRPVTIFFNFNLAVIEDISINDQKYCNVKHYA